MSPTKQVYMSSNGAQIISLHHSFSSSFTNLDSDTYIDDDSTGYGYPLISSDEQSIGSSNCITDCTDNSISSADQLQRSYDGPSMPFSLSVPFKWEEAPGKPLSIRRKLTQEVSDTFQYGDGDGDGDPSGLELPPKLHIAQLALFDQYSPLQSPINYTFQSLISSSPHKVHPFSPSPFAVQPSNESPLNLAPNTPKPCIEQNTTVQSPCLSQSDYQSPNILHRRQHGQKIKQLWTSMLKTASWSQSTQTLPQPFPSWSSFDSAYHNESGLNLATNDRFFFDRTRLKCLKHSASMDSLDPTLPLYDESCRGFSRLPTFDVSMREDEYESRDAMKFLAMDDCQADKDASSSPKVPILYLDRDQSSSWLSATTDESMHGKVGEHADDFQDCFSTTFSFDKHSQRISEGYESASSLLSPWSFDFSPHEEEDEHVKKGESKMRLVREMAFIKFKNSIMRKLCGLNWKRERASFHVQANTMWSPTLATYLYNLQKEEKASILHIEDLKEEEESSLEEEAGPLTINYRLPTRIRGQLVAPTYLSEDDDSMGGPNYPMRVSSNLTFLQEQDKARKPGHRVSLREKLAEFDDDDECPLQTTHLSLRRREIKRGTYKFRKAVQALVATIKLLYIPLEPRKRRRGWRRSSLSYLTCIKPTPTLLSPSS